MERRSDLLIQELSDLLGTDEVYFQPDSDAGTDEGEAYIFYGNVLPVLRRQTHKHLYSACE